MEILPVAAELLQTYPLCDHCLGRQFAQLGYGIDNAERGRTLKTIMMLDIFARHTGEERSSQILLLAEHGNFAPAVQYLKSRKVDHRPLEKCYLCKNLFSDLDTLGDAVAEKLVEVKCEFDTFLVGARIPGKTLENEDAIRSKWKLSWGESVKSEFTRVFGKLLQARLNKRPAFLSPELVIIIDLDDKSVEIQPEPLFIYGRYKKLKRGIPQSAWHCGKCQGRGCEECNWTGKKYTTSISELLEKPFLEVTGGESVKLHAAGREDVDARTLGSGRPFVVEVKRPRMRHFDLGQLMRQINERLKDSLEVSNLTISNKQTVRRLKISSSRTVKTYRAIVELGETVAREKLETTEAVLKNVIIRQQTPQRVLHRRADKVRSKRIYEIHLAEEQTSNQLEVIVKCQGGVYVKEFITGDSGRTTPSLSESLGIPLKCLELDIIDIEWEDSGNGKTLQGVPHPE